MKTFALFGFLESGRNNIIAVVHAMTDEDAARKLGGHLVRPTMNEDEMLVYAMRLPQLGEGWNQFQFGNDSVGADEAMRRLGKATKQPPAGILASVQMVATNCDHLVLARVPFLEE